MWILRLFVALVVTMTLPVAAYFMSDQITREINANLAAQGFPPFETVCAMPEAQAGGPLYGICLDLGSLPLLHKASIVSALSGLGFVAFVMLPSMVIGRSRTLLSTLFPVVVQISLYYIVLGVLLQGAVLTLASYVAQSYYLGSVRMYLVAFVAIGALVAAYKLLDGLFAFSAKLRTHVDGVPIDESKAPGLLQFVRGLAEKLGAQPPDNLVVGLQPNFFATSSEIVTSASSKPMSGSTLYVSLPLARMMTVSEFAAVVGHELGHFRGDDTEFSVKFAPVYAGLSDALSSLRQKQEELVVPGAPKPRTPAGFPFFLKLLDRLAKVPARALLAFVMDVFAMNVRAVGRQRELVADKAGAEASDARTLITALMKTSFYADLWQKVLYENIDRLHRGKASRNLSSVLEGKARYDVDEEQLTQTVAEAAKRRTPHPTDRHPTIGERMKALGVEAGSIAAEDLTPPDPSAILLFRNARTLGENLSVMEHKRLAEVGLAPPTGRGTGGAGRHLSAIYRIAIAMIGSEGAMSAEQVRAAEAAGTELFEGFEVTDFRQNCEYADEIPDMEFLAEELNELLDDGQKQSVITFLTRIAKADGEIVLGEQVYIDAIAEELSVAVA